MIKFELNEPQFSVTNDVMVKIIEIIGDDWSRDYDIVEHTDFGGRYGDVWLWAHPSEAPDEDDEQQNPIRHWITEDGELVLSEEVTWDWKDIQHDE